MDATIDGNGVNIFKPLQFASLNVVLNTALGIHLSSPQDPLSREILDFVSTTVKLSGAAQDMSNFLPILSVMKKMFFSQKERRMKDYIATKRDHLSKQFIKQALEDETECFLKLLYERKDQLDLDDDDIMVIIGKWRGN